MSRKDFNFNVLPLSSDTKLQTGSSKMEVRAERSAVQLQKFLMQACQLQYDQIPNFIHSLLEHPGMYKFGPFLSIDKIVAMQNTVYGHYYKLLRIYAYGSYVDYTTHRNSLPSLTPIQKRKLQQLSIVSLAASKKAFSYAELIQLLGFESAAELERTVTEAITAGIMEAKINRELGFIVVEKSIKRDGNHACCMEFLTTKLHEFSNIYCASNQFRGRSGLAGSPVKTALNKEARAVELPNGRVRKCPDEMETEEEPTKKFKHNDEEESMIF